MNNSETNFPKKERLHGKKNMDVLFAQGEVLICYPYRIIFNIAQPTDETQVLVSVPKRTFKKAVHRNWIKRRVRESYRLRKGDFKAMLDGKSYYIAFLYIGKERHNYAFLDEKMAKALQKLVAKVNKKATE